VTGQIDSIEELRCLIELLKDAFGNDAEGIFEKTVKVIVSVDPRSSAFEAYSRQSR